MTTHDPGISLMAVGPEERRPVPDPTMLTVAMVQREIQHVRGEIQHVRESIDDDWAAYKTLLENKFHVIEDQLGGVERQRLELKADRVRELADSQRAQDTAAERMRALSIERMDSVRSELNVLVSQRQREMDAALKAQYDLTEAKLDGIKKQIDLADRQRTEQKSDAEKNVQIAQASADKALRDFMTRYERAHDELYQLTERSLSLFREQVNEKFLSSERLVAQQNQASDRAITKSEAATAEQLKQLNQTFSTAIESVNGTIADLKDRVGAIYAMRLGAAETRGEVRDTKADSRGLIALWVAAASVLLTIVLMIVENSIKITGH